MTGSKIARPPVLAASSRSRRRFAAVRQWRTRGNPLRATRYDATVVLAPSRLVLHT
jgi:hypothetical protein